MNSKREQYFVSKLKYFNTLPTLSYGGYSNDFNLGLAFSKGEKNKLTIGTQHLEDVFAGDKAKSVSIYFNLLFQESSTKKDIVVNDPQNPVVMPI